MLSNDYGIEGMTDPEAIDYLAGMIQQKQEYIRKLEDALCSAICIIQNAGGPPANNSTRDTLFKWADELIAESGIDFDTVLKRETEKKE